MTSARESTSASGSGAEARRASLLALLALTGSIISVQTGASLAKQLFPLVGAAGAVALRQGLAAPMLILALRPWRGGVPRRGWAVLGAYGVSLAAMNLCFYLALRTLPLGVAVAIEFVGPLAVAVTGSRRRTDFLWIALAVAGLLLLVPRDRTLNEIDRTGALCALGAGVCWGVYIIFGRRAGQVFGTRAAAGGITIAALILLPIGVGEEGVRLFSPTLLGMGLVIALLTSAVPYTLEMIALPRLPPGTFGTLMSLSPAAGAVSGFLLLGERLNLVQGLAIAAVMGASAGAAISTARIGAPSP